jgi:C4-type Zn-finger protein
VQGLLQLVLTDLQQHVTSIRTEDGDAGETSALALFLTRLESLTRGGEPFTLVMDDPLSNSVSIRYYEIIFTCCIE